MPTSERLTCTIMRVPYTKLPCPLLFTPQMTNNSHPTLHIVFSPVLIFPPWRVYITTSHRLPPKSSALLKINARLTRSSEYPSNYRAKGHEDHKYHQTNITSHNRKEEDRCFVPHTFPPPPSLPEAEEPRLRILVLWLTNTLNTMCRQYSGLA
jgi:hypothetical protein